MLRTLFRHAGCVAWCVAAACAPRSPAPTRAPTNAPGPQRTERASGSTAPDATPPPAPAPTPDDARARAASVSPPPFPRSAPGAPELPELRARLAPLAARRFDAAAQQRGCPADQTLGQYLAMLVDNGERGDGERGTVHRLAGACADSVPPAERTGIDPPADPAYWLCRIEAFSSDPGGESPWRYELRLRVRRADRAVELAHVACPGGA